MELVLIRGLPGNGPDDPAPSVGFTVSGPDNNVVGSPKSPSKTTEDQ